MTLEGSTRRQRTSARSRRSLPFEPPAKALVVAALVTPVVTTAAWAFAYWVATTRPAAPSGDTTFAWMPVLYVVLVGPIWLFLALQSAWAFARPASIPFRLGALLTLMGCAVGVTVAFGIVPGWTSRAEGFPIDLLSVSAVVLASAASLLPAAWLVVALVSERVMRGWVIALVTLATVCAVAWAAAAQDLL
jgi:hypothetical protein